MLCTVFGSHLSFTSEEASERRKLWKPKRTHSSSLITLALMAAGRRYFCTMIEADRGFLPLRKCVYAFPQKSLHEPAWQSKIYPKILQRNVPLAPGSAAVYSHLAGMSGVEMQARC